MWLRRGVWGGWGREAGEKRSEVEWQGETGEAGGGVTADWPQHFRRMSAKRRGSWTESSRRTSTKLPVSPSAALLLLTPSILPSRPPSILPSFLPTFFLSSLLLRREQPRLQNYGSVLSWELTASSTAVQLSDGGDSKKGWQRRPSCTMGTYSKYKNRWKKKKRELPNK